MPESVPVANGWWQTIWHVRCGGGIDIDRFVLPAVPPELVVTRIVLSILPRTLENIDVVVMTDDGHSPHNLTYVSLVMQELVASARGEVLVEDLPNHPVLRLARPTEGQ